MTQDWNEILSEPMERLQPDLPAADGGWRAVRPLEEVSPRPQQPPLTLPDSDSMLSVHLPVQSEERPPGTPPPESLTEQLSLTWASRKTRAQASAAAPNEPAWPEWSPEEPRPTKEEATPKAGPVWLRPLQSIGRLLRRDATAVNEAPVSPRSPAVPVQPASPPVPKEQRAPSPAPSAQPKPEPEKLALDGGTSLPLTLAQGPRSEYVPARAAILSPTPPAPLAKRAESDQPESRPEPKPDGILRHLLRRDRPAEAPVQPLPQTPPASGGLSSSEARSGVSRTPLVHRETPIEPTVQAPKQESATTQPASPIAPHGEAGPLSTTEQTPPPDAGEPLSAVLRSRMEGLVDVPLREVRVFRNSVSRSLTTNQRADAVTIDNQVHMAPGEGNASTPSGEGLLAHELSHYAARQGDQRSQSAIPEREEARAQVIEHAIQRQADFPFPPPIRAAPTAALQHRMTQAVTAAPVQGGFDPPRAFSAGNHGPSPNAGGGGSSRSIVLARAPLNRIAAAAAQAESSGPASIGPSAGIAAPEPDRDEQRTEPDEASLVARVVESVMRRLRREGALERERRGAFHSEIGG